MMPAGVPLAQSPSLQRQSSHHSSLAAVVLGMMQNSKRTNVPTTRKLRGDGLTKVVQGWFTSLLYWITFHFLISSCSTFYIFGNEIKDVFHSFSFFLTRLIYIFCSGSGWGRAKKLTSILAYVTRFFHLNLSDEDEMIPVPRHDLGWIKCNLPFSHCGDKSNLSLHNRYNNNHQILVFIYKNCNMYSYYTDPIKSSPESDWN